MNTIQSNPTQTSLTSTISTITSGLDSPIPKPTHQEESLKPIQPYFIHLLKRIIEHPIFVGSLLVLSGVAVAFQSGCNATLNRYGGRAFSSFVSFGVGTMLCYLFFLFDVTALKTALPTRRVKTAPWFAWMGGLLGSYYVIINILTVPKLGAGTVLSIFVCAQVIMACLIDHFGLVGVKKRKYSIWRILASIGLIGCVVVIAKF